VVAAAGRPGVVRLRDPLGCRRHQGARHGRQRGGDRPALRLRGGAGRQPTASVHVLRSMLAEGRPDHGIDGYPTLADLTPRRCAPCDSRAMPQPSTTVSRLAEKQNTSRARSGPNCSMPPRWPPSRWSEAAPGDLPDRLARIDDELVIHGSTGSPWLRQLATARTAAVSVTALDGVSGGPQRLRVVVPVPQPLCSSGPSSRCPRRARSTTSKR